MDILDDIEKIEPDVPLTEPEDDAYPIIRDGYDHSIIVSDFMIPKDEWAHVPDVLRGYLDAYADAYRIAEVSSADGLVELRREAGAFDVFLPFIIVQFNVQNVFLFRLLLLILSAGVRFHKAIRGTHRGRTFYFLQVPFVTDARDLVWKGLDIGEQRIWELTAAITVLSGNIEYSKAGNIDELPEWMKADKVVKEACHRADVRRALHEK